MEGLLESVGKSFENRETAISRDLKLNILKLLEQSALSPEESAMALLALSHSIGAGELARVARSALERMGVPMNHIQEVVESGSIMAMLNTYYSFKNFMAGAGSDAATDYGAAGLRMTSLARPQLGKERFEMLAFSVSVLNKCETCVRGHEAALRSAGVQPDKIHDLARLAAVVKAVSVLTSASA